MHIIPSIASCTLVGGFKPSEKYEFVNWDDYSQSMEKKVHAAKHQPDIYIYINPNKSQFS